MNADLFWLLRKYKRCSSCKCMLPIKNLEDGKCVDCIPRYRHKCFFCKNWKVNQYRHRVFGLVWICRFCKRKDDEVVM